MMNTRRILVWSVPALLLVAALAWSFWPRAIPVETSIISRGPLVVEVSDEGRMRVREIYQISAPVAGRLLRVVKHSGDSVTGGETIVADLLPTPPSFLDIRSRAQGEEAVKSAEAARNLALAEVARAKSQLAFAASDLARARKLRPDEIVSRADLERAELANESAAAQLAAAQASLRARESDLAGAKAALINPGSERNAKEEGVVQLRAPVSGKVLRVLHENVAVIQAGAPILEIGDPRYLEILVELTSEDAVKVHEGARARITDWGGAGELAAHVRRVEPSGFTKMSALGVEEQRVNVLLDFADPAADRGALADGFRVTAHIVTWEKPSVLRVPAAAMFRQGKDWAVFAVRDGRAVLTPVTVGHANDEFAELESGLKGGDAVILHPSDRIRNGVAVAAG